MDGLKISTNLLLICILLCVLHCNGIDNGIEDEKFGICSSSFLHPPSIQIKLTEELVRVCIPQSSAGARQPSEKCGKNQNQMCIAVYYLNGYNIPIFSAFRISGSGVGSGKRPNVKFENNALDIKGEDIVCKVNNESWGNLKYVKKSIRNTDVKMSRGHLTSSGLGNVISIEMAKATFNMFNAAPQFYVDNGRMATERYETTVREFAKNCSSTIKITDSVEHTLTNVETDFYSIVGTIPSELDGESWIDETNIYSKKDYRDRGGSNIPSVFWTATCCLYTFNKERTGWGSEKPSEKPSENPSVLPITYGYYVKNDGIRGETARDYFDDDLRNLKSRLNRNYANKIVINIDNFFGVKNPCEESLTYNEAKDLFKRYIQGLKENEQNLEVDKLITAFRNAFGFSSFLGGRKRKYEAVLNNLPVSD